jgi:mannose-6-phosphate isomerase-like protein (cupin superfamily)
MGTPDGISVVDGGDADPTSGDGLALLARLLDADPADVRTFDHQAGAGQDDPPHVHTETLVAWIVHGTIAFVGGPRLDQRVEVGPGQLVRVDADVPHAERVVGGEPLHAVIAHVRDFEVRPFP